MMENPLWSVTEGDCRASLSKMRGASVHAVVTSPPYFGLRASTLGEIGGEKTPEAYVAALVEVFDAVHRVLRDDGTLWLNIGDSFANDGKWGGKTGGLHPPGLHGETGVGRGKRETGLKPKDLIGIPWMVAFALRARGWHLRMENIWHKPNPTPESVQDRTTKAHENVFMLTKTGKYFYDQVAIKEPAATADPDSKHFRDRGKSGKRKKGLTGAPGQVPQQGFTGQESYRPADRNKRSVWTIPTFAFAESHYATFPPDLVLPCVLAGTSAQGCCAMCGSPMVRIVKRTRMVDGQPAQLPAARTADKVAPTGAQGIGHGRITTETETLGWKRSCACDTRVLRPCVVLDPFSGAGTTGVVALRLGRSFIGLELNPAHCEISRRRIVGDAPLFNRGPGG